MAASTSASPEREGDAEMPTPPFDIREALASLDAGTYNAAVHFDSPYTHDIVLRTLGKRPYIRIVPPTSPPSSLHLQWLEFEVIDWPLLLSPPPPSPHPTPHLASSYCTRKGLIRKAQFAHLLHKYSLKRSSSPLLPSLLPAFVVDIDHPDYVDEALCDLPEVKYMADGDEQYILKASMLDGAQGLHLIRCTDDFVRAIEAHEDVHEWVVQRYVQRPLLVDGRKWHVRAYVVAVGNLRVFLYNAALALFALHPYDPASSSPLSHITNTCASAHHADFSESRAVALLHHLPLPSGAVDHIHTRMALALGEVFTCMHSEPAYFQPLAGGFEVYGVDWLVDDALSVWLLEVNAGPDFGQSGGGEGQALIEGLMEEVAKVVDCGLAMPGVNLATAVGEGIRSGHIALDDGTGDWDGRKGRLRECYARVVQHTTSMRYY